MLRGENTVPTNGGAAEASLEQYATFVKQLEDTDFASTFVSITNKT